MKPLLMAVLVWVATFCVSCSQNSSKVTADTEPPSLLPWPASLVYAAGEFSVSAATPICAGKLEAEVAQQLQTLIAELQGLNLPLRNCATPGISLSLQAPQREAAFDSDESYTLEINSRGIVIRAAKSAGLYYGAVTLAQLLSSNSEYASAVSLRAMRIQDTPRYAWRGLMLDPSRHFLPLSEVKTMIAQMAQLKLNRLHLHLSDDQGWRIEIKRYPRLTEVGGWRLEPAQANPKYPNNQAYGGFYTQDDIREIVAYAAKHHIEVIPEIDMPGHAQAAVAAYPEIIGVNGDRPQVSHDWGINPYLFSTSDASMQFIKHVLDEIIELFPYDYIHLGGDEAIKDQWQASAAIQAQIKSLGVKDAHQMQGWFMAQLGEYLVKRGKKMIGWDEILEGGVPPSATVMSWRGNAGTLASIRLGHDVVQSSFYLDNLQSTRADEPAGRLGFLSLSRVYHSDIMPAGLSPDQRKHILGAQGHLWSEFLNSPWYVQRAAFPRSAAIAEILWSRSSDLSWAGFLRRLPDQMQRFKRQNISAADMAFAVNFGLKQGRNAAIKQGRGALILDNQVNFGEIRYTLDGSEPSKNSSVYQKPLSLPLGSQVKAATFDNRGRILAATRVYEFSLPALRSRDSSQLQTCYGGGFGLRMPLTADSPNKKPVFNADIFHNCYVYPKAALAGIAELVVNIAKLPRHYGLAHEAHKVKTYPKQTAFGEMVVYLDQCDSGRELARIPLANPASSVREQALVAPLPATEGTHNLCVVFTAPLSGPFYAIDSMQLQAKS